MVWVPLTLSGVFAILFIWIELKVAPEPVLAPFLLKQKIPVLVGISNFLVATCNFSVMYNFPTWFQTVMLTSASEAGEISQQLSSGVITHIVPAKVLTLFLTVSPCRVVHYSLGGCPTCISCRSADCVS